jgi:hypothetical protein
MALQDAGAVQQVAQQATQQITPWLPVFTFVLGQLFAILLEWLRGQATAARERAARNQAREEAIADRRDKFQRKTLLALQDALTECELAGLEIKAAGENEMTTTGTWSTQAMGQVLREKRAVLLQVDRLLERVLDKDLRQRVQSFIYAYDDVTAATSKHAADAADTAMTQAYQNALLRAGEILRGLY